MVAECLFTGKHICDDNSVEHALPRSMGGRIRSDHSTHREFNNRSSKFDNILVCSEGGLYFFLLNELQPLMASEYKLGQQPTKIIGEEERDAYWENGELRIRGIEIKERDPKSGKPTMIQGPKEKGDNIKDILSKAHGQNVNLTDLSGYMAITDKTEVKVNVGILNHISEIAILKSCLIAFDATISSGEKRFTRSPHLEEVRNFIRRVIMDGNNDISLLEKISLGIQYEKCLVLNNLRERVDGERQEFEHVLVATGDSVSGNLDIVWNIFGIDPYGFRVCTTWDGEDFTVIIVNQVLKDGKVLRPKWLKSPSDICQYTKRCHWANPDDGTIKAIVYVRADACSKAAFKKEMEADEYVWKDLKTRIEIRGWKTSIQERIRGLYQYHERDWNTINRIIDDIEGIVNKEFAQDLINDKKNYKQFWLCIYRECLLKTKRDIGPPNKNLEGEIGKTENVWKIGKDMN
jgi:hypothetical protein